MVSILFAFVCVLTISPVSSQLGRFKAIACPRSLCDQCTRQSNVVCTWCSCSGVNEELCREKDCEIGTVCKVVETRGWFPRSVATCVKEETLSSPTSFSTTTTPSTSISNSRQCITDADCRLNEICRTSPGQSLGTCSPPNQRSLSPKCSEEKRSGPCRAGFRKFYYNSAAAKCEEFFYGGCDPSENNFETMEECQRECELPDTKEEDPCTLEMNPGICRALFENYYHNMRTGKCEKFSYGGCGGNANRFLSLGECESRCVKKA